MSTRDQATAETEQLRQSLLEQGYVADSDVVLAVRLALGLERPLLIEGEPGVGKTELAPALAGALQTDLIRLQCYEGLGVEDALYEWNYGKQLLEVRTREVGPAGTAPPPVNLFGEDFLIQRPLLRAIASPAPRPPVLLIDEVDRADPAFEAILLEILSDFQVSVPELGTIAAKHRPVVILTSNRTREVHEALRRRCLYLWLDFPTRDVEALVVSLRTPGITATFAEQVCDFVQHLREADLRRKPGTSETLEWAASLLLLGYAHLDVDAVRETRSSLLKNRDDQALLDTELIADLLRHRSPFLP